MVTVCVTERIFVTVATDTCTVFLRVKIMWFITCEIRGLDGR